MPSCCSAGAVILGKTNLSEWANFRSTQSSSGWSGRGGLTRNPYALDRNPCDSSAGTGAAIAASLATVGIGIGIGSETDGSITCPTSDNGLVGLRAANKTWRAAVRWVRTARSEPEFRRDKYRFRAPAAPAWRLLATFC